jgi:hypothetical protein
LNGCLAPDLNVYARAPILVGTLLLVLRNRLVMLGLSLFMRRTAVVAYRGILTRMLRVTLGLVLMVLGAVVMPGGIADTWGNHHLRHAGRCGDKSSDGKS